MAQLVGLIVSGDDAFTTQIGRLLRSGAIPVSIIDDRLARDSAALDLVIVDTRGDPSSAMSTIERMRAAAPNAGIFVVALQADPDLILQSMRAGANEFFTWPPPEETFHGAIRRTAARRETTQGAKPPATTLVFFGAKGGAGTTTLAVNCGVELSRLSKRSTIIIDLKPGLGEVALFLGVRQRYSLIDALDNLHRLDREFLKELVVKHKSGLDILGGSDNFDRPGAADAGPLEEVFRLLAKQYDYILIDAGSQINSVAVAALVHRRHDVSRRQSRRAVGAQCAAPARSRATARGVRRARAHSVEPCGRTVPDSAEANRSRARPPDPSHLSERLQDGVDRAQLRRPAGVDGRQRNRGTV